MAQKKKDSRKAKSKELKKENQKIKIYQSKNKIAKKEKTILKVGRVKSGLKKENKEDKLKKLELKKLEKKESKKEIKKIKEIKTEIKEIKEEKKSLDEILDQEARKNKLNKEMKEESIKDRKEKIAEKQKASKKASKAKFQKSKKSQRFARQIFRGQAHIQCSYNNTMVAFTDLKGSILAWSSSGLLGFKGAKKSTPYVATQVVNDATSKVKKHNLRELEVFIKGVGGGREASVRALAARGFDLKMIQDITPIPHNGCRPPKPRRV
jgi:small subunit ribosomal protein S11